jgi:tetratricopeptide (TPR) repeat protein
VKNYFCTTILFLSIFATSLFFAHCSSPDTEKNRSTLYAATEFFNLAEKYKFSEPDSALTFYSEAISLLAGLANDSLSSKLLSSTYAARAYIYANLWEVEQAEQDIAHSLELSSALNDVGNMAKAKNIEALIAFWSGEPQKALDLYSEALLNAEKALDNEMLAKIVSNRAQVYNYLGDNAKTEQDFVKALEIATELGHSQLIAGVSMNLGVLYETLGMPEKSVQIFTSTLKFFREHNDRNCELICLQQLGNLNYLASNYSEAIDYYNQSQTIAVAMKNKSSIAKNLHNLGEVYFELGDIAKATAMYFEAIKIKEEMNDELGLITEYYSLGNLYFSQNDYSEAMSDYRAVLQLSQKHEKKSHIGKAYSGMANVFSALQQRDSALFYYHNALEIYTSASDKAGMALINGNIGMEYAYLENFEKASAFLSNSVQMYREIGVSDSYALALNQLSAFYLKLATRGGADKKDTNVIRSEKTALEAWDIARESGSVQAKLEVSKNLKNIYKEKREYTKSLVFSEKYNELKDSVFSRDKAQSLVFAKARWESDKKQQEIDALEQTSALQADIIEKTKQETRQQRLITWFIAIMFILGFGLAYLAFLYSRKKRDAMLQKQRANITLLKMQNIRNALSPHFVFNVLNNIWAIIDDRENARKQFDNLMNMIRRSLINTENMAIPLKEEIEFVKSFIELQNLRIGYGLNVEWNISERVDLDCKVPGMTLQIPVENAIKHGLLPKQGDKNLEINVVERDGMIHLSVSDNGIGYNQAASSVSRGTGTGIKVLTNTMHMLNQVNVNKMSYEVLNLNEQGGEGTQVSIKIPADFNYELN